MSFSRLHQERSLWPSCDALYFSRSLGEWLHYPESSNNVRRVWTPVVQFLRTVEGRISIWIQLNIRLETAYHMQSTVYQGSPTVRALVLLR